MAELRIRQVDDGVYEALKQKAANDGDALEPWLRQRLTALAAEPEIRHRYVLRAYDLQGAVVEIRRVEDEMSHSLSRALSDAQRQAATVAIELVKRNGPGDREGAVSVLKAAFPPPDGYVFETVM